MKEKEKKKEKEKEKEGKKEISLGVNMKKYIIKGERRKTKNRIRNEQGNVM
jgi:hypothetical protein